MKTSSAFTLLEMLVVLLIVGILTTTAVIKLAPRLHECSADEDVERLQEIDCLARRDAMRSDRSVQMVLDLSLGEVYYNEDASGTKLARLSLQKDHHIEAVKFRRTRITAGVATVAYSSVGCSESYAIQLKHGGVSEWIFFAGLTGETERVSDDAQIQRYFDLLQRGHDAG